MPTVMPSGVSPVTSSTGRLSATSSTIATAVRRPASSPSRDPDAELVAAEAAGDAVAGEHARDLGQDEVAGAVAVVVVDGLEAVDVADQHARPRCRRRARGGRSRSSCGGCAGRSGRRCGRRPRAGRRPRRGRRWRRRARRPPSRRPRRAVRRRRRGARARSPSSVRSSSPPVTRWASTSAICDAGGLVGRAGEPGRAAVVVGDRARDVVVGLGEADQQRAGGGVVEPEELALELGARRAVRAPRRRSPRAPATPNAAGISSLPTSCSRPARWAVSVCAPRSSAVVAA